MFLRPGTEDQVVPWRGPMLHRTLEQFLADVYFGDLDVLLIDMPPGTGDVAISVGHLLPHAEVLVVTTPQPAASDVAVRSGLLARQLGQRVIGVVETMAPTTLPTAASSSRSAPAAGRRRGPALHGRRRCAGDRLDPLQHGAADRRRHRAPGRRRPPRRPRRSCLRRARRGSPCAPAAWPDAKLPVARA